MAELHATLEALPAPIYTTDASGVVTFFNAACIAFSGRQPEVGKDKWCVTWKLYTESGEFLPHDECPMAVALAAARPVRGVTAVAERPDGVRVTFVPLPTPILDGSGQLIGAANLLLDITEVRQIADLRSQAQRARRLLAGLSDPVSINALTSMSEDYEAKARDLEATMSLALP
ncbi:PAS domain-containing protein [Brevundimonas sp.]|uniref:PAS domain-containing protein n=1 Tax=Brevundimonas sp. TaxID=1871086 RepID=UPI002D6A0460|nr:PAS domain-containing protein [Brevundimonas sp.]HYC68840.1 PAS domain-containing protein [Brevundimonas sp.]